MLGFAIWIGGVQNDYYSGMSASSGYSQYLDLVAWVACLALSIMAALSVSDPLVTQQVLIIRTVPTIGYQSMA